MKSLAKEWISTPFYCGKNKGNLEDLCAASLDLHLFPCIFVGLHSWKRIRDCSRTLRQVADTSFDVRSTRTTAWGVASSFSYASCGSSFLCWSYGNGNDLPSSSLWIGKDWVHWLKGIGMACRGIAYSEGKRDRQRRTRMNKEFHLQCVRSMLLSLSYERF